VVPKHRRSDNPSLVSVGAPVRRTEFGPEAAGRYPASNGYSRVATEPGWADALDGYDWQEWQDWHDWAPPATLHPDHPSAPVPRVQLSADHPSGPYAIPRALPAPGAPRGRPAPSRNDQLRPLPPAPEAGGSGPRGSAPQAARGPGRTPGLGRHGASTTRDPGGYVAAAAAGAAAGQVNPGASRVQRESGLPRREPAGFERESGLPRREPAGYQRQASPGWQETTDYRRETGPFGPGPGPASGRYQNGRSAGGDSLSRTGQLRSLANGSAVQVAPEAHDDAAAIREAAQLEAATITQHATGQAAAIREAAAQEAAELRARLDAMLGELDRMAPSLSGRVAAPARPATAPALPGAQPGLPRRTSARPTTAPARPGAEPGLPRGTSARPAAKPTRPDTRPDAPTRPRTAPASQSQTRGRQAKVMRVFVWGTAAALAFATIAATTEIAEHGFGFFAFREGGVGETPGTQTDQDFEQGNINIRGGTLQKAPVQKAATQAATVATKGKHHKTS
jgi:hypothetical protein